MLVSPFKKMYSGVLIMKVFIYIRAHCINKKYLPTPTRIPYL